MPRLNTRAAWLAHVIEREAEVSADADRVRRGYALLEEILGGPAGGGAPKPIHAMMATQYGGRSLEWHELGFLLEELRGQQGFDVHLARLLSDEHRTLRGKLVELSTLLVLRRARQPARLARESDSSITSDKVCDIILGSCEQWGVEVSYLDIPSTWAESVAFRKRMQHRLVAAMQNLGVTFAINLEVRGYARELAQFEADAANAFARAAAASPSGREVELVDGFRFSWSRSTPFVNVGGCTVLGADPGASERVWTRLLSKITEEAAQVSRGGIVLIHTDTLAIEAAGDNTSPLYEVVLRDLDDYVKRSHLGAVGVVEQIISERLSDPGSARRLRTTSRRAGGAHWQRLLWLHNPQSQGAPPRNAAQWFAPPYPW